MNLDLNRTIQWIFDDRLVVKGMFIVDVTNSLQQGFQTKLYVLKNSG